MSYREHPAPPVLQPWLACLWERRGNGEGPVRVLPDGCIDIVWSEFGQTALVGVNTTAFMSPVSPGARVAGARLRPGAAPALLGIAAEESRDAQLEVASIWGDAGARLSDTLDRRPDATLAALERWLLARLPGATPPDPLIMAAVARLERAAVPIAQLSRELAVSERGLRRQISRAVGYGPKRLARIFRLRRTLEAARTGESLAGAAISGGYADQAHFTRECMELARTTPSALA